MKLSPKTKLSLRKKVHNISRKMSKTSSRKLSMDTSTRSKKLYNSLRKTSINNFHEVVLDMMKSENKRDLSQAVGKVLPTHIQRVINAVDKLPFDSESHDELYNIERRLGKVFDDHHFPSKPVDKLSTYIDSKGVFIQLLDAFAKQKPFNHCLNARNLFKDVMGTKIQGKLADRIQRFLIDNCTKEARLKSRSSSDKGLATARKPSKVSKRKVSRKSVKKPSRKTSKKTSRKTSKKSHKLSMRVRKASKKVARKLSKKARKSRKLSKKVSRK
jgi:hypothetical protein